MLQNLIIYYIIVVYYKIFTYYLRLVKSMPRKKSQRNTKDKNFYYLTVSLDSNIVKFSENNPTSIDSKVLASTNNYNNVEDSTDFNPVTNITTYNMVDKLRELNVKYNNSKMLDKTFEHNILSFAIEQIFSRISYDWNATFNMFERTVHIPVVGFEDTKLDPDTTVCVSRKGLVPVAERKKNESVMKVGELGLYMRNKIDYWGRIAMFYSLIRVVK